MLPLSIFVCLTLAFVFSWTGALVPPVPYGRPAMGAGMTLFGIAWLLSWFQVGIIWRARRVLDGHRYWSYQSRLCRANRLP